MTARTRLLVVACGAAALAWSGAFAPAADPPDEPIAARVGGRTITRSRLDAAWQRANVAAVPAGPQRLWAEATVLEQQVDETLLQAAVAEEGIEPDAAVVDGAIKQLRQEAATRGGTLEKFLTQTGRTEAGIREQIAQETALRQFLARRITPQAVRSHYEKNRREYDGTLLRISHLVLRPDLGRGETAVDECLARAAAIRTRILEGEITFAEAVKAHSAGPSRRRGGDVGFMPRRSEANEEFASQAFALAKGDISRPFVTPFGVHIVQVTDIHPGTRSLAQVQPQIEQLLASRLVRETVAAARRSTTITYAAGVPHFDPATPADGPEPRRVVVGDAPETP